MPRRIHPIRTTGDSNVEGVVQPGGQVDGYRIEALLGRGGEAAVYRAHRAEGTGVVALKVLDEEHRDRHSTARLAREFRIVEQLTHPHVVRVYDHGAYWLAMQYVDGGNAAHLPSLEIRLQALAQVAEALDDAHRRGIVHSDVKPTNILVHQDFSRGGAVLIDFGTAYVLAEDVWHRPTRVLASLPYAAPELLQGRLPQAATDEYALACTALEVLTGHAPFPADNATALIDAHLNSPPPEISHRIPGYSKAFDLALARAIAKDPDRRYGSCTDMVQHLADAVRRSAQST